MKKKIYKQKTRTYPFSLFFLFASVAVVLILGSLFLKTHFPAYAAGTTYYVSSSGNDTNNGLSQTSPWQTINKVNSMTFQPGDSILFEGGQTFYGKLYFTGNNSGTMVSPITIASYGTTSATINGGTSDTFFAYKVGGFSIHNIIFSGTSGNTGSAINFYTDTTPGTLLDYIAIADVSINGFNNGISIGSNNTSGYSNVSIKRTTITNGIMNGLITYAGGMNVHKNITVDHVTVSNITGVAGQNSSSGNGILLGGVDGAVVDHSMVHDSGQLCTAHDCAAGIWTYDANNVTIQHSEVYNMHTGGSSDGDGFDLDKDTKNSVIQYNYSHNNDGPGLLLANNVASASTQYGNNTIRYNISENDARKNPATGAILAYGSILNTQVYNNTVYTTPNPNGIPNAVTIGNWTIESLVPTGLYFRNNIFQTTGSVPFVNIISSEFPVMGNITFQQNNYFASGASWRVIWGTKTYTSLSSWQGGTGEEKKGTSLTGITSNPLLTKPGTGGTITNIDNLATLSAYKLQSSSPMRQKALNLTTNFGINPGPVDFYGTTIPQYIYFDIGAHEYK
ncbi:MAG TPA: hypothetical protein VLF89_04440 [Candidatus Saccharimonadales bacterium]|nr:hypothetical protein [Candidatus Saccharimonadales bacterium]